jgi:hypothetical protein
MIVPNQRFSRLFLAMVPAVGIATPLAAQSPLSAVQADGRKVRENPPRPQPTAMPAVKELFTANEQWRPIRWQPTRIVRGSALDFSSFLDAPAGKHGAVVCRDGRFVFSNAAERPARSCWTALRSSTVIPAWPFVLPAVWMAKS